MGGCKAFAPGRTELAGNHVDHQNGVVLTSTLSLGIAGEACTADDACIRLESAGYGVVTLDMGEDNWQQPRPEEANTTAGLLRGAVAQCVAAGIPVGGLDVRAHSTLPAGGGLSSSAAFELLLITIMQKLFSRQELPPLQLARMAQRVEWDYFGKRSGFMDQAAIALGGVQLIDFGGEDPRVTAVPVDFAGSGFAVCLIDVGVDHSVNHEQFAAIPNNMWDVARLLGVDVLRETTLEALLEAQDQVRTTLGDVAFMRALHYFREVELTQGRAAALQAGDLEEFCRLTALSGASSSQYLQNVTGFGPQQPAMVALALVDLVLDQVAAHVGGPRGVCRIHGGGFGGTLQAFVPQDQAAAFAARVDELLGEGSSLVLELTQEGARAW